jgi:hypothetical protein
MRQHARSPFIRIKMAVSAASVALALTAAACPFAAAADPTGSPTSSASASDGAASPTASAEPSVTPDGSESGSSSLDGTTPDTASSSTPEASVTSSPSPQPLPSRRGGNARIAAPITVSGVLRDATTGAPIRNSCVAWRPWWVTSTATNGTTRVEDEGRWWFDAGDPGPFYIAFYVTADGNCDAGTVLTGKDDYRASWYSGQPFTGTDPKTAQPPEKRSTKLVDAGSDIVACLATQNALPTSPTECTIPDVTVSGRVVGFGPMPIFQACVVAFGANDMELGHAISDADGRWKMSGLPIDYDFIVGVVPPFRTREGPCAGGDGDGFPPAPPPGALQPEFFEDTWADLSDQNLRRAPFAWATDPNSPHPAGVMRNNQTGIDVCLTTETGRATERSSCDPATPTPTPTPTPIVVGSDTDAGAALAATGGPSPLLPPIGAAMVLAAVGMLARSRSIGRR